LYRVRNHYQLFSTGLFSAGLFSAGLFSAGSESESLRLWLYHSPNTGYLLKAGQIRRDKKELRSFLSCLAVVALTHSIILQFRHKPRTNLGIVLLATALQRFF
jgi:hypothetical protein